MDKQTELLKQMAEAISLTTLSEKNHLHIVSMKEPGGTMETKIVFARGHQVGLIINNTYMVRPEFFDGGRHYNIFVEQETKLIREQFRLKEVVMLDLNAFENAALTRLKELKEKIVTAENKEQIENMIAEAHQLANELGSEGALKISEEIRQLGITQNENNNPDDLENKFILSDLVIQIRETPPGPDRNAIVKEAEAILAKLPDSEDIKNDRVFVQQCLAAISKGVEKQPLTVTKDEKSKKEIEEAEFNEFVRNADIAFDQKDYKKAKHFYQLAHELRPDRNRPMDQLNIIKTHLKEQPETKTHSKKK